MSVFLSTINQMAFLFLLIIIGFVVAKLKAVPDNTTAVLSKLENNIFIPALVLSTFVSNFTVEKISEAGTFLLVGLAVILISMPVAVVISRIVTKDKYIQNINTYGLAFANFGFMGNAVVSVLFPDLFMGYLIYVLPFWFFIYLWGVPYLLIPHREKGGILQNLKALVNPMFIAMLVGIIIGISGIKLPSFFGTTFSSLGSCMSPVAMLLTGMTVAQIDIKKTLKTVSIYIVSLIRLIIIPLIALLVLYYLPLNYGLKLCTMCALSMPLGLNAIVVPAAYGKDTSVAAGMALVSHLLSCATIPVIFLLFQIWIG